MKTSDRETLGIYLKNVRQAKRLTLREVEAATDISNSYLSQIENNKIKKPSPHFLYKLAEVYGISYELLMEKVGYIVRGRDTTAQRQKAASALLSIDDLTSEEEEALLEYLAFLRSRTTRKG